MLHYVLLAFVHQAHVFLMTFTVAATTIAFILSFSYVRGWSGVCIKPFYCAYSFIIKSNVSLNSQYLLNEVDKCWIAYSFLTQTNQLHYGRLG